MEVFEGYGYWLIDGNDQTICAFIPIWDENIGEWSKWWKEDVIGKEISKTQLEELINECNWEQVGNVWQSNDGYLFYVFRIYDDYRIRKWKEE